MVLTYIEGLSEELVEPNACVIFTADYELFTAVAALGRSLIFEATWGERFGEVNEIGQIESQRYRGSARLSVSPNEGGYPSDWSYDAEKQVLKVGAGIFTDVRQGVLEFSISGMKVIPSWLGCRMENPAGKSTSPLDRISADEWTHDTALLDLLWQVEFVVDTKEEGQVSQVP
ncbi:type ISP restriction/modification enzyme [Corynebacterium sp.]|uniref:type ISP restriction/modification enzyme n=1 Tax=Corynebacterium sp. TaxID=1720 RepID=UPI002A90E77A|nr:type ISP restriction/modification enzyme [Corynebacterium sp.]MDY5785261.1 type ISP restriction/modification enzyme [Corynebacterium sp.]